jgi:hypothetical protein
MTCISLSYHILSHKFNITNPHRQTTAALGFVYLAYTSIPTQDRAFSHLSTLLKTHPKAGGYLFAASMALSILPFTRFVMLPNNMALMNKNAEKGGQRSVKEAKGEKEGNFGAQFRPQGKLEGSFSEAEEKEVREMMGLFISQNLWRAGLLGVGGLAGLWTALV